MHEQEIPYINRIKEALSIPFEQQTPEAARVCAEKLARIAHEAEVLRAQLYEIFKAAAESDIAQIRHIFKMCECYKKEPTTTTKSH